MDLGMLTHEEIKDLAIKSINVLIDAMDERGEGPDVLELARDIVRDHATIS